MKPHRHSPRCGRGAYRTPSLKGFKSIFWSPVGTCTPQHKEAPSDDARLWRSPTCRHCGSICRGHGSGGASDLCSDAERIEWARPNALTDETYFGPDLRETARTDEIRCPRHFRLLPKMDSQQT